MNHDHQDPILDAFLTEAFDQAAPPDLSQRIVDAWSARETQAAKNTNSTTQPRLETAVNAAVPVAPPLATPDPLTIQPATPGYDHQKASLWPRVVMGLALGVAVLTVLIAVNRNGDQVANDPQPESPLPAPKDSSLAENGAKESSPKSPDGMAATKGPAEDGSKNTSPQPLKNTGPSAFEEPAPFERAVANGGGVTPTPRTLVKANPLDDQQVVAQLNGQLNDLWQVHAVGPSQLATDAEFCRRVFIALIGRIPTVHELDAFLMGKQENKRAWLVNRLQTHSAYRPLYVANWTNFWTNVLIGRTGGQKPGSLSDRAGLATYLQQALEDAKPYDQLVTELITAEGVNRPGEQGFNGAVNFMLDGYSQDSTLATARTARVFHGRQIQCVQCHNHPINETWMQNNFWEFNAFFRQMDARRVKNGPVTLVDVDFPGESGSSIEEAEVYYERLDGVKRVAYPVFFDGRAISKRGDVASINRRQALAKLMVDSPELSRAAVNRIWAKVFRFGLANPIDDMGSHNPPDHPQMLELLAQQFEANRYSLDRLIRWMVMSDAFQLSSKAPADNLADNPEAGGKPLFSRYYTRQLSPEAVYDSLMLAANQHKRSSSQVGGEYIKAQRAWLSQFSSDMGTDEGQETNTFSGDIRQSVVVMTSPVMERAVSNELGGVLNQVSNSSMTIPEKIEHLFLAALSRKPTPKELKAVRTLVDARRNDPVSGLQDIWWALLNSNEFILDH